MSLLPAQLSYSGLIKTIFSSDNPERIVKTLAPQTLFALIHHAGIESSTDLIELLSKEQYELVLDLELWTKDIFNEFAFWRWLSCVNEPHSLAPFEKFLGAIDTRLIGLLVLRYVEVEFFEETSEQPFSDGFYTPDNGYTWIKITCSDLDHYNLFARFLAYIFETDPDLFYRLLGTDRVATQSILEEDCYNDKTKELEAQGIPDCETSWKVHCGLDASRFLRSTNETIEVDTAPSVTAISPIVHDGYIPHPLCDLITELLSLQDKIEQNEFEQSVTWLINTGVVRFGLTISDWQEVILLIKKIRGAINIGLELCNEIASLSSYSAYSKYGAKKLYQFGLQKILITKVRAVTLEKLGTLDNVSQDISLLLEMAKKDFPECPEFLKTYAELGFSQNNLATNACAFEHIHELDTFLEIMDDYFGNDGADV